ncbi:sensor histidine kinase [Bacillus timonensis]|uniref:sensor histidine kinase n=1 Tax=Bacillus timonensis TaxID=1033734 RepID=UPI000289DD7C|nr:sensor histidine kinase [Bacillus timonensis]
MRRPSNRTLYQKLLFILIALTIIPVLIISIYGYHTFSRVLYNMIAESNYNNVNQMGEFLSEIYQDMDSILTKITIHPDIQDSLKKESKNDWNSYQEARFFTEYTNLLMVGHPEIKEISVYNFEGKRLDSEGHFLPGFEEHFAFDELRSNLENQFVTTSKVYTVDGDNIISFGKKVIDLHTGKYIGIAILDLNLDYYYQELGDAKLLKSGYFILMNQHNEYLFHPTKKLGTISNHFWIEQTEKYKLYKDQNGNQMLYFMKEVPQTGWKVFGVVPYDEVVEQFKPIRLGFLVFIVIILCFIFLLALSIRKLFVKPIQKLQESLIDVQNGDFQTRVHFNRKDEIGILGAHFNAMVMKIEELIKRVYQSELRESKALLLQKQAEIDALQEKITPHFLYNTLNSISWFANRKGIREIQIVVDSLSQLLRYSLKDDTKFVTLKEEFNYLKLFGEIIDFRYDGEIEFIYHLPSAIDHTLVPRFLIQPIVENAIKYAFDTTNSSKVIEVICFQQNKNVVIEVKDNGIGIEDERLKEVYSMLDSSVGTMMKEKRNPESTGIGLANVHQRIKLTFGDEYGVKIESEPDQGTKVTLILPYYRGEVFFK